MTDNGKSAAKKRPWYKGVWRKTGIIIGGIGAVAMVIPGAPVIATIGGVSITTTVIAVAATWIATNVFTYGAGKNAERPVEN